MTADESSQDGPQACRDQRSYFHETHLTRARNELFRKIAYGNRAPSVVPMLLKRHAFQVLAATGAAVRAGTERDQRAVIIVDFRAGEEQAAPTTDNPGRRGHARAGGAADEIDRKS